jgi:predicted nucleic acid-binding protein
MAWPTKNAYVMSGNSLVVDTNILIYYFEGNPRARALIEGHHIYASSITAIELLGYAQITPKEESIIRALLAGCHLIELTTAIQERTIQIKQAINIKTPDAIIAASALELGFPLATEDTDFDKVPTLAVVRLGKNL